MCRIFYVSPKQILYFYYLTIYYCSATFPYSAFNGHQVNDLSSSTNQTLYREINSGWSISGWNQPNSTTVCNSVPILGGPGVLKLNGYFKRYYGGLPNHDVVYFRVGLYIVDDWQSLDTVIIKLDLREFSAGDISLSTPYFQNDLCGNDSFPDLGSFYIMGRTNHTDPNITMMIKSAINRASSIASFGVRQVNLLFANRTLNGDDAEEMSCNSADVPIIDNNCTCPIGSYLDPLGSGQCLSCHSNCADCFGPLSSQCYACNTSGGFSFVGTDCIACNDSCLDCTGPSSSQCIKCHDYIWSNKNNTCTSACDTPLYGQLTIDYIQVCMEPCIPGELYYWNKTCSASCPKPLVTSINIFGTFCNRPCSTSAYLNWNNKCISSCPYPLVQSNFQSVVLLCNKPCSRQYYFFPDGQCELNCTLPMVTTVINGVSSCLSPCANFTNYYYYEANETCISTCEYPNIIKDQIYYSSCVYAESASSLTPNDMSQIDATISVVDIGTTSIAITTTLVNIIGASNVGVSTLIGFLKMMPYIKYVSIDYPPKLQYMLNNLNSSLISFSIGFSMNSNMVAKFHRYPLFEKFEEYQLHSNFIVNYWQTLTSLIMILAIILVLSILMTITKGKGYVYFIFKGVRLVAKWNFFFMVLLTNLDQVVLPTSLQMRTIHLDSFTSVLGVAFCVLINIVVVLTFALAFYIIKDLRRNKNKVFPSKMGNLTEEASTDSKWHGFQIFYKGSKDEKLVQHIFIIPYLFRIVLFNIIIAYLYKNPLTQVILITLLSLVMLTYMLWKKPFISKLVLCQHVSDEIIMLSVNACMLVLAILDKGDIKNKATRILFGDFIIALNLLFNVTANIYLAAYLITGFIAAYKAIKSHRNKGILAWLTALLAPFEIGGMDLEVTTVKEEIKGKQSGNKHHNVIGPQEDESPRFELNSYSRNSPELESPVLNIGKSNSEAISSLFIQEKASSTPQNNSSRNQDNQNQSIQSIQSLPYNNSFYNQSNHNQSMDNQNQSIINQSVFEPFTPFDRHLTKRSTFGRIARSSFHNDSSRSFNNEEEDVSATRRSIFAEYSSKRPKPARHNFKTQSVKIKDIIVTNIDWEDQKGNQDTNSATTPNDLPIADQDVDPDFTLERVLRKLESQDQKELE